MEPERPGGFWNQHRADVAALADESVREARGELEPTRPYSRAERALERLTLMKEESGAEAVKATIALMSPAACARLIEVGAVIAWDNANLTPSAYELRDEARRTVLAGIVQDLFDEEWALGDLDFVPGAGRAEHDLPPGPVPGDDDARGPIS